MTFSLKNKGIIALDLDGTVTEGKSPPSSAMTEGLNRLYHSGWKIAFITGRSLNWVRFLLKELPFPYFLAVQNGAFGLAFPEERICFKHYIAKRAIPLFDEFLLPFAIYSGDEKDTVYWEPEKYTPFMRSYLEKRVAAYGEHWEVLHHLPEEAAALKAFGTEAEMHAMAERFRGEGFCCTVIRDPFDPAIFIALATHALATKGEALKQFKNENPGRTIAAGDDMNDLPLFREADIAIAMPKAPENLKIEADLIAHDGLISTLNQAIL